MHLSHKALCIRPIYMNENKNKNKTKQKCFQTYFRVHDRKYENNFFFFIKLQQNPNST